MHRFIFLFLIAFAASPANAASFDCKAAHTPREQAICSDPKLSALDDKLAAAYKSARASLSSQAANQIQSDQREWLHWLDQVCPPKNPSENSVGSCLTNHYNTRLAQLTTGIQKVGDATFFSRAHFVFVPDTAAEKAEPRSGNDPGFGYGEFAWPQIDNPAPPQAAWNTAVYAAAIKVEASTEEGKSTTFDAAVDSSGNNYGFYTLRAANSRLVDVDLGISTYGWGAAHPNTGVSSFIWWLDRQRPLVVSDVFRADSSWQQKLVDPIIQKLRVEPGEQYIWKGDELTKAVSTGLADTSSWGITFEGLTITYGQYSVGPYVIGMPTPGFRWNELQPFLNPALAPTTLPKALVQ
jgi:uncharacterized protein